MQTTSIGDQTSVTVEKIWKCLDTVDILVKVLKPISVNMPELSALPESGNIGTTPILQILETLDNRLKNLKDSIIL